MGRLNESLDLKHDVNVFGFVFGKLMYWNEPCREIEILAYKFTKFDKWQG